MQTSGKIKEKTQSISEAMSKPKLDSRAESAAHNHVWPWGLRKDKHMCTQRGEGTCVKDMYKRSI